MPAENPSSIGQTVCVTGAGGYIASWIVKFLLEKGYSVRGTVRNPDDPKNCHLRELEGAKERLVLCRADLEDYESIKDAINGCDGIFHTASPVTDDPITKKKSRLMFRARDKWIRLSNRLKPQTTRDFCTGNSKKILDGDGKAKIESSISHYTDTYKQLDNLDFMKAAKILFSEPRNKKKFGFDFHLVQFIAACLPSLAVYFVAQYARREMKKMDAELEEKRKKEEEEKAKQEEEQRAKEENERTKSQNEIAEVKSRLNKLEEAVKQAVESRPRSGDSVTKTREEESIKKQQIEAQEPVDDESRTGKKKR